MNGLRYTFDAPQRAFFPVVVIDNGAMSRYPLSMQQYIHPSMIDTYGRPQFIENGITDPKAEQHELPVYGVKQRWIFYDSPWEVFY